MTHQGNRRTFYLFGLLVVLAMVFTACAAPAAGPSTGADGAPAAAAPSSDLPAEPGRGTDGTLTLLYFCLLYTSRCV